MKLSHYAANAISKFIRDQWADEISVLLGTTPEIVRNGDLDLFNIPLSLVRVELMDGSSVDFFSACSIVSGPKRAIAVLTEHCGYHIFPIHEAKIYHDGKLIYQQVGENYP